VAEVVARSALHRPDVAFTLEVDGKVSSARRRGPPERAARVLGADRMETLLPVSREQGTVLVEGFVASPTPWRRGAAGTR
jgi:DNA mismatch repair ATPase MutL